MTTTSSRPTPKVLTGALAVLLALTVTACADDSTDRSGPTTTSPAATTPTITGVWARPGVKGGNTAIYFTVTGGTEDDELLSVAAPDGFAGSVEIHETVTVDGSSDTDQDGTMGDTTMGDNTDDGTSMDGGHPTTTGGGSPMMTMRPVDSVPVPAGKDVDLAPGGLHVMVMGLHKTLAVGDRFTATVTFEHAGTRSIDVVVREM